MTKDIFVWAYRKQYELIESAAIPVDFKFSKTVNSIDDIILGQSRCFLVTKLGKNKCPTIFAYFIITEIEFSFKNLGYKNIEEIKKKKIEIKKITIFKDEKYTEFKSPKDLLIGAIAILCSKYEKEIEELAHKKRISGYINFIDPISIPECKHFLGCRIFEFKKLLKPMYLSFYIRNIK